MTEIAPPEFSIVIPARNEERNIGRCLDAIRASAELAQASYEVVVVINRCTDRTEEIARAAGCRIVHNDTKNLSSIRNSGVRATKSSWIITIDADSRMSINMLREVRRQLLRSTVVGGGVVMLPERWSLGILITGLLLLPYVVVDRIAAGLFFFRRDDFEAIGGFNEQLVSAEDIDFARRLKAHGQASKRRFTIRSRAHIVTSCRKFDHFGDWHFVLKPWMLYRLLSGRDREAADRFWYNFPRDSHRT